MPRARKRTLAMEKTSVRVRAMRPRVITGATSLRRSGRRRRRGLPLVLARALGLELVGADHPASGRVLADDHHVDTAVERVGHLAAVRDLDRLGLAREVLNSEVHSTGVSVDRAVQHLAADLDVLAVVLARGEIGDLTVVGTLFLDEEDDTCLLYTSPS